MLTHVSIRNFKLFRDANIELGNAVVLIGPNNSGKTTALQALALWNIGLRKWNEKRKGKASPEKRPGVTINRRDLISIPVPGSNLLWRDLHVREVERSRGEQDQEVKQKTSNVRIEIEVRGVTRDKAWVCAFEFDFANDESFYCRPLRTGNGPKPGRVEVPPEAAEVNVAFLPPMSGLTAAEPKWEPGRVNVLIGEGQTAQVLRNLCFQVHTKPDGVGDWQRICDVMRNLFGIKLLPPVYVAERGEITMAYREQDVELDISSSGRGLQQTLLLLAHLYSNPRTVLLLDEPDAHLEFLRQREVYTLLTDTARAQHSQIIAASHSEVVLAEACAKDTVIAFVGTPHRINDRGSQLRKSLCEIGFDQYVQAEQEGWVLYLEGPTDLAILQAFAKTLGHPAHRVLERPFVYYVGTNQPGRAESHFFGLSEAKPDLVGIAIFDRLEVAPTSARGLTAVMWRKREIENYLCIEDVLFAFARRDEVDDLFQAAECERRVESMREAIREVSDALRTLNKPSPWSNEIKASDDFLDSVFHKFGEKLGTPPELRKTDYHLLARHVPAGGIDPDVVNMLDLIMTVANKAKPAS